jgi:hypothetical protein
MSKARLFDAKHQAPTNSKVNIYWERVYRYVTDLDKLFGDNVHICKGELGCAELKSEQDYKLTPFSQCDAEGALFEMNELEEDILDIEPKLHQLGTGVVSNLSEDTVIIKRIFFNTKTIDKKLHEQVMGLKERSYIQLVEVDFAELLMDGSKVNLINHKRKNSIAIQRRGYASES